MKIISTAEFRDKLHIEVDSEGLPPPKCVARLVLRAIDRWNIAPTTRLLAYVKRQLAAAELEGDEVGGRVREVCDRLVLLGSIERVYMVGRPHFARAKPRWIRLTDSVAVLTGTHPVSDEDGSDGALDDPMDALVQRVDPSEVEVLAWLRDAGATEWSLDEWRGQPGYVPHLLRRSPNCTDVSLSEFWRTLSAALDTGAQPLSSDAVVRAVAGEAGAFFGSSRGAQPTGRWTETPPDGVWCGARKGYGETQWRPILLSVDGETRRVIDLYDFTEWRWALVARGEAISAPEVVARDDEDVVRFSYPLPDDVLRLMCLVARRVGAWAWRIPDELPDVWSRT